MSIFFAYFSVLNHTVKFASQKKKKHLDRDAFCLPFSFTKALSSAFGTFCNSFAVQVHTHKQMIPFRLEFLSAFRANVGSENDIGVEHNKYHRYQNRDEIPRHLYGFSKPIGLARGKNQHKRR